MAATRLSSLPFPPSPPLAALAPAEQAQGWRRGEGQDRSPWPGGVVPWRPLSFVDHASLPSAPHSPLGLGCQLTAALLESLPLPGVLCSGSQLRPQSGCLGQKNCGVLPTL